MGFKLCGNVLMYPRGLEHSTFLLKKILLGIQTPVEVDSNLGGLNIHAHPQSTDLGSVLGKLKLLQPFIESCSFSLFTEHSTYSE
jgi:hypothetical protein